MKVHYPKLYNMTHLSLNVFTASKGSNNYILLNHRCISTNLLDAYLLDSMFYIRRQLLLSCVIRMVRYIQINPRQLLPSCIPVILTVQTDAAFQDT